jgi:hypothetical protein
MEGEYNNEYSKQKFLHFNHEHRDKTKIIHKKSKYLNRMDEAFKTICSLISLELLFDISSFKTPNEYWTTMEGIFEK